MSLISNTTKIADTNGVFSFRTLIFCCCNKDASETPVEILSNEIVAEDQNKEVSDLNTEEIGRENTTEEPLSMQESNDVPEPDKNEDCPPPQIEPLSEPEQECLQEDTDDMDNISDYDVNMAIIKETEIQQKTKTAELRLRIGIDSEKTTLNITIVDSYDLARPKTTTSSIRGHVISEVPPVLAYSVHILVLPAKKLRFKTKMRQGPDPFFDEAIKIPKVNIDDVKKWAIRFRLYGSMRNAMKEILGEGYLILESLTLETRTECKIALMNYNANVPENVVSTLMSASRCNQGSLMSLDSIDRMTSIIDGDMEAEVLIGLAYSLNTGRLTMEIVKGNKFPKLKDDKQPDTLIGVVVTSNKGEEITSSKTAVKKGACEPVFEEKFVFQILVYQLEEVTLTVSGYHKKMLGRASVFGSFIMGNKNSTEEETNHWKDLILSGCGDQILRWHTFHSPSVAQDKT